jgi:hypothetical protein
VASPDGVDARQDCASRPRRKGRRALSIIAAIMVLFSALWANSIALFAPSDKIGYISAAFYSVDALVFRLTRRTVPEVDPSRYRLVDANQFVETKRANPADGIIITRLIISDGEYSSGWTFFVSG